MATSCLSGFHDLSRTERLGKMVEETALSAEAASLDAAQRIMAIWPTV